MPHMRQISAYLKKVLIQVIHYARSSFAVRRGTIRTGQHGRGITADCSIMDQGICPRGPIFGRAHHSLLALSRPDSRMMCRNGNDVDCDTDASCLLRRFSPSSLESGSVTSGRFRRVLRRRSQASNDVVSSRAPLCRGRMGSILPSQDLSVYICSGIVGKSIQGWRPGIAVESITHALRSTIAWK